MTLESAANLVTVVGLPLAAISLWWSARQLKHTAEIAEGTFLLNLEQMCQSHDPVHRMLRPGGHWSKKGSGPESLDEWAAVEDYMGFFEHCEHLIANKSISEAWFKALFAYRIHNIVANERIVRAKLHSDEAKYWATFTKLCRRLEIVIPGVKQ